jgi:hypothetical protein
LIGQKYSQVLRILLPMLSKEPLPTWVITGNLGFALQGLAIDVQDVDLQTDADGAYEIERRLSRYSVRRVAFSATDRIRSHFGALEINGIRVEIMGALQKFLPEGRWEEPVDVNAHRRWVDWEGMRLPVISITYEQQAYTIMGRTERSEMLKQWLKEESNGQH